MKVLTPLLALVLLAGCARKDPSTTSTPSSSAATREAAGPSTPAQTSEVLVEVNGARLHRHEAELQVRLGVSALNSRRPIPQNILPQVQMQTFKKVIDQFITVSLLTQEADRQNIKVSDAEIETAMASIRQRLPPGQTLEEVMARSPMGKERMREDIVTGVRINRLVEPMRTNLPAITDQQVKEFYNNTRRARHILIKTDKTDEPAAREAKRKKAEDLRRKLVDGADFPELAKVNSDCPSKDRGGELGVFPKGKMDPIFEAAAFALKVNEISPVVETPFGYHIIQAQEFAEGKDGVPGDEQVRRHLATRQQDAMLTSLIDKLKSTASIVYSPSLPPFITQNQNGPIPTQPRPSSPPATMPIVIPPTAAPEQQP